MPTIAIGPPPEPPPQKQIRHASQRQPELWEQLQPITWRGISFPVSSMRVTIEQDTVEHKYWGVDGASVEPTGRAPMHIEATIPFVNGIVPGKGETWSVLYPDAFRAFIKAFADKTSDLLFHPELQGILCKPKSLEFSHDAQRRDGVIVTARWVETLDDDHNVAEHWLTSPSPIQAAELAALDLDASKDNILNLVPDAATPPEDFASFMNKLQSIPDSVTFTANSLTAIPNRILYHVDALERSVERAHNALTWPVTDGCERMKEAMFNVSHMQFGSGSSAPRYPTRKTAIYRTVSKTTIARLATDLKNTVDDLMALNPSLCGGSTVVSGVDVRYYA